MWEIYQLWLEYRDKPLTWTSIAAILIYLLDRFGRKFITSQVKRLFHVEDSDFKQYIANQRRIENKIDALLQKEGIEWPAPMLSTNSKGTARKNAASSLWRSAMSLPARIAGLYIKLRRKIRMNNVNWVTLIVALLGAAKIVLEAFGINVIDDDMIDKAANAVAAIVTLVGVIMSHRKTTKGDNLDAYIRSANESAE